jgi:signal transduction histidine kinase
VSDTRLIVASAYELINARRFDDLGQAMHPDVVQVLPDGSRLVGLAAVADHAAAMARAAPDMRLQLERVLAESETTVVTQTKVLGLRDAIEPRPSAGRSPLIGMCVVYLIAGGLIKEFQLYDQGDPRFRSVRTDRLVAEQSALRRVATLVARAAPQSDVLEAIVTEAAKLLETESWLVRTEDDGRGRILAAHGAGAAPEQLAGEAIFGGGILERVSRSGRPSRIDSYAGLTGPGADLVRQLGVVASAAAPLIVQGTAWGALIVVSRGLPLETGIEDRLAQFAHLAATAIANAQSRAELELLAASQAALRRVAELVARSAAPAEVFGAVTVEASRLLGGVSTSMARDEPSGAVTIVAQSGEGLAVGTVVPAAAAEAFGRVRETRRVVRLDDFDEVPGAELFPGIKAAVLAPIVVAGRVWGVLDAYSSQAPLPADTEERLSQFAELVAAAIANAESRAQLLATAERRVALADREAQLVTERNRLGREIHDVLAHTLGAVSIQLTALDSRVAAGDPPEALRGRVRGLHSLVGDGLQEARDAVRALRDDKLSLETQVRRLCALHGATLRLEGRSRPLRADQALALYRVVQEALTNAAKHAPDASVTVALTYEEGEVTITVDNQRGSASSPLADTGGGHGLDGMRARVELVGGRSTAGPLDGGWRVTAAVPRG